MSKGLEKLKKIQKVFEKLADWNGYDLSKLNKDFETDFDLDFADIETALKAFEIIKKKRVHTRMLQMVNDEFTYLDYNKQFAREPNEDLTQEEYDLLKEVLL